MSIEKMQKLTKFQNLLLYYLLLSKKGLKRTDLYKRTTLKFSVEDHLEPINLIQLKSPNYRIITGKKYKLSIEETCILLNTFRKLYDGKFIKDIDFSSDLLIDLDKNKLEIIKKAVKISWFSFNAYYNGGGKKSYKFLENMEKNQELIQLFDEIHKFKIPLIKFLKNTIKKNKRTIKVSGTASPSMDKLIELNLITLEKKETNRVNVNTNDKTVEILHINKKKLLEWFYDYLNSKLIRYNDETRDLYDGGLIKMGVFNYNKHLELFQSKKFKKRLLRNKKFKEIFEKSLYDPLGNKENFLLGTFDRVIFKLSLIPSMYYDYDDLLGEDLDKVIFNYEDSDKAQLISLSTILVKIFPSFDDMSSQINYILEQKEWS